jgi:NAD(P)-dependent dehydrogenase (short-subunit alcohol dehydrogenase family)
VEFSLKDQVALVSGASRGMGKAIALEFARAGADVALVSRKLPDLEKVAEEIHSLGRRSIAVAAHVAHMEDIRNLVDRVVEAFGRIDILINNAGTNPSLASAMDMDERAWDATMNLNLKGLFFLSQAVAKIMKKKGGGKIIHTSSIAGISPGRAPVYAISKAAVIMATKVMAKEWAPYNIRVNAIAPGLIRTRFSEAFWNNPDHLKSVLSRTPMNRIGEAEEIIGAVLYLASDASTYVTGQVIAIDGGATI